MPPLRASRRRTGAFGSRVLAALSALPWMIAGAAPPASATRDFAAVAAASCGAAVVGCCVLTGVERRVIAPNARTRCSARIVLSPLLSAACTHPEALLMGLYRTVESFVRVAPVTISAIESRAIAQTNRLPGFA